MRAKPPTGKPPRSQTPAAPDKPALQMISMKTPAVPDAAAREHRPVRQVRVRAISEVTPLPHAQPANLGFLAPPRDSRDVHARRVRDYVMWGSMAVILASAIALAIWFIGR